MLAPREWLVALITAFLLSSITPAGYSHEAHPRAGPPESVTPTVSPTPTYLRFLVVEGRPLFYRVRDTGWAGDVGRMPHAPRLIDFNRPRDMDGYTDNDLELLDPHRW